MAALAGTPAGERYTVQRGRRRQARDPGGHGRPRVVPEGAGRRWQSRPGWGESARGGSRACRVACKVRRSVPEIAASGLRASYAFAVR